MTPDWKHGRNPDFGLDFPTKKIQQQAHALTPGEKLHEELLGEGEVDHRPRHRLISQALVPGLPGEELANAPDDIVKFMESLC